MSTSSCTNHVKNSSDGSPGIPVGVWDETLLMFRVEHSKGKSFSSGGFGVAISSNSKSLHQSCCDSDEPPKPESLSDTNDDTSKNVTRDHLFLEEAMFLHEQGLIECRYADMNTSPVSLRSKLDLSDLYKLLPQAKLSLAIYLTYAHLRSQTYRVWRHSPVRRTILQAQQNYLAVHSNTPHGQKSTVFQELKRKLRHNLQHTPAPQVHTSISLLAPSNTGQQTLQLQPAFDVYPPQSNFSKSHPGLPDFSVIAFYYAEPLPRLLPSLYQLAHDCDPIPLKVATVSDNGLVVMFGLSTLNVPTIED